MFLIIVLTSAVVTTHDRYICSLLLTHLLQLSCIFSLFLDMVRNHIPKRPPNDPSKMKLAVDLVVKDNFTLRKASERTGVAFQTLAR